MTTVFKQRSFWFGALLIATSGFFLYLTQSPIIQPERPVARRVLPVYGTIQDFNLLERRGQKVTAEDLRGRVWIADFIFTRCAGICPVMTASMKGLLRKLEGQANLRFVSLSVDPQHDTPEVLTEYAKRRGAESDLWIFLTGDQKRIFKLSEQHFKLGVSEIPEAERSEPDQTVDHSSKFVLVDQEGQIRGYYSSEEEAAMKQLVEDAKLLLRE